MARSFTFKDKSITIGDTISLTYKIREGDKIRQQKYAGIVIKVKGDNSNSRTITVRRISRSGIGVERIIPLASPLLQDIKVTKKGKSTKSNIYFIRNLSEQEIRHKIYH